MMLNEELESLLSKETSNREKDLQIKAYVDIFYKF